MKKKLLATLLAATMVAGLVVGCGTGKDAKSAKSTENGTEVVSENSDSTEATEIKEEHKYGTKSKAYSYKDKVSAKTLTDKGWVRCEANGLSFYAPKECNTYSTTNGTNSLCIVGLNEDLYNDVEENTAVYGATDLYAVCVIDASSTFKSDKDLDKSVDSTESTEADNRVVIKNGVFTKGETEKLIPTVLSDEETSYKVMFDNDEMIMYQLDDSAAYLGFIYGTTNIVEIIFDPASYEDIYEIKPQYGKKSTSDSKDSTAKDSTESTESKLELEDIEGRTGYLSGKYLDAYKSAVTEGEIGKLAYKKGYFMNDELEAALIMTIERTSKESSNTESSNTESSNK